MNAIFDLVKPLIFEKEGEYTNDPDDSGGETKWGISQRAYANLDIINLTIFEAYDIYERDYWNACRLSEIHRQEIANKIFLTVINLGITNGVKCVQRAINAMNGVEIIKADGILGNKTLNCVNNFNYFWLLDAISLELIKYYNKIVEQDAKQGKFFRGWVNRALS